MCNAFYDFYSILAFTNGALLKFICNIHGVKNDDESIILHNKYYIHVVIFADTFSLLCKTIWWCLSFTQSQKKYYTHQAIIIYDP